MNPMRLVLPALRWRAETGFSHEDRAIDLALEAGVGGFIVFGVGGARADEIGRLTEEVRHRAGRPLLIGADLERGAGQQARRLTEIPPPGALGSLGDPAVIEWAGATTAREARRIGINWVFAPVADLDLEPENPIVQSRSFGASPAEVGAAVATWTRAAQREGVLACAKHYPGHGRTRLDSHHTVPSVTVPLEALEQSDLEPFRAAVAAGVASVMTAHVAFPAWDPSGVPATRSRVILNYLRRVLNFDGLIVTDALIMGGAQADGGAGAGARDALMAGCDLLLYPPDPAALRQVLDEALAASEVGLGRLEDALARYERALAVAFAGPDPGTPPDLSTLTAARVADLLLERGLLRGSAPDLGAEIELIELDDDVGGWFPPGPSDLVRRALGRERIVDHHGGKLVVLAFAEPRAAKGRAGFSPETRARLAAVLPRAVLLVLFGHPRLARELPGECPILGAWHRQPLMQEAVSRWIARRMQR